MICNQPDNNNKKRSFSARKIGFLHLCYVQSGFRYIITQSFTHKIDMIDCNDQKNENSYEKAQNSPMRISKQIAYCM